MSGLPVDASQSAGRSAAVSAAERSAGPRLPLALRREQLLVRSADLRLQFAEESQALAGPLAAADRVVFGVRWLVRNPVWPVGAVLLWLALRPRRTLGWAGRVWWVWRMWQSASRLLHRISAPS